MNVSEEGHIKSKHILNNPLFREELERIKEDIRTFYNNELNFYRFGHDNPEWRFIKYVEWLLSITERDYYMTPPMNKRQFIVDRDFTSAMTIGYVKSTLPGITHFDYVLEIESLDSFKKGQAYKFMKKVIELSHRILMPIVLFVETEKNYDYFKRYGFKDYGNVGDNNETLMVYLPE